MSDAVIVGVLALIGTLAGTLGGILTANRLTVYRIDQLEKKVDRHNSLIERMAVQERDTKALFKRVDEIREALQ